MTARTAAPRPWLATDPRRFTRLCILAAAAWLFVSIPAGMIWRPTDTDFAQFYMGGLMVRLHATDALYPIPDPESVSNPGLYPDSTLRPREAALRKQYGAPDDTRFMLPPPSALLFVPLSLLSYKAAEWSFLMLLTACTWGVAVYAARFQRLIAGRPTLSEGLLVLLITFSPMTCRAIRITNVTPIIALLLAVAVNDFMRRDGPRAAVAILVAGLLKYAGGALVPLVVAMRRWRTIGWLIGLALVVVAAAWGVMGSGPFLTFNREIAPLLNRPSPFIGNQTVMGMIFRMRDPEELLPKSWSRAISLSGLLVLGGVLLLLFRRRPRDWRSPVLLFAGCSALLSWMMAFGPVAWEHYPIFLCPFWGWLLWESRQSRVRWMIAWTALALINLPLSIFHVRGFFTHDFFLPEPQNSSQLAGVLMVLGLAMVRVAKGLGLPIETPAGEVEAANDSPALQPA